MADYGELLQAGINAKNNENYTEAVDYFTQALALDDHDSKPWFYRANIYNHSLKEYNLALADYDEAIKREPENEFYYYNRALCSLNLGDVDAAREDYNSALAINADYALALWDRALIYAEDEEYAQAIADLTRVLELSPYSAAIVYKDLANVYFQMGDKRQALTYFNQSLDLDSYAVYTYKGRGNLYLSLGEYAKSLADYEKVKELNPKDAEAYNKCALIYEKMGDMEAAAREKELLKNL